MSLFAVTPWKKRRLKDYDPQQMVMAIQAVKSGQMTAAAASKFYGVPRTTIITRIQRNTWMEEHS